MTENPEERMLHGIALRENSLVGGSGTLPAMALSWIARLWSSDSSSRIRQYGPSIADGFSAPAPHSHHHPHSDWLGSLSIEFGSDHRMDIASTVLGDPSTEL